MKKLPNDCSYTELWVNPANWKTTTTKASLKKNWYVQCYFYDPTFSEKYPEGFAYRKKANKFKTLEERKAHVQFMLDEIPKLLEHKGWNPITKKFMLDVVPETLPELEEENKDIGPNTPFLEALNFAKDVLTIDRTTSSDLTTVLKYVTQSALQLRYDKVKVGDIRRKHIRFIIDNLEKTEGKFSGHKFNKYRTHLQILFRELLEFEAVETNIINDMRKRVQEKKIREVLTADERLLVNNHLKENYPSFWAFTILFFHSGGRIVEMLRLQIKDVDLEKQVYRTLIQKGKQQKWIERPIKDIGLPLWRKAIFGGRSTDFVFSKGLVPGEHQINRDQISKRWRIHVKEKLGISSDFYALKHLNLDETTNLLSMHDAARMAGHTDTKMVESVYAVGEKDRAMQRLKTISNKFA